MGIEDFPKANKNVTEKSTEQQEKKYTREDLIDYGNNNRRLGNLEVIINVTQFNITELNFRLNESSFETTVKLRSNLAEEEEKLIQYNIELDLVKEEIKQFEQKLEQE